MLSPSGSTNSSFAAVVLRIGFAYAFGVVLALTVAGPTSGEHLNPGVTTTHCVFGHFPIWKLPFSVFAQILRSLLACMVLCLVYRDVIWDLEATLTAAGTYDIVNFTPQSPAEIFGLYVSPNANLGSVFWTKFSSTVGAGTEVAAVAANSARDLRSRMMVICIWGRKAAGGNCAAIAALTNIPATLLSA
ncbi:hypothetical protein CALCODRAFT_551726 [Calocera cornea HHB12733]|uniref:Aquaporin-like protein n=1 Tax=Calocera cornea HHB12733 TaxID=1353952 RepID=A0A165DEQ7_9BASI|nr:hypothetical protein CALCODRAFT_551726 [Calocera cornea HHB12733]